MTMTTIPRASTDPRQDPLGRFACVLLAGILIIGLPACSTGTTSWERLKSSIASKHDGPARLVAALAAAESAGAGGLTTAENRQAYAESVKQVVLLWQAQTDEESRNRPRVIEGGGRAYRLTVSQSPELRFDELIPAMPVKDRKFGRVVLREGVGASFVGTWKYTPERKKQEPFLPQFGYATPVTATLDFRGGRGSEGTSVVLRLLDPRLDETVTIAESKQPLAGDFSAVGEWLGLEVKKKNLGMSGIGAMRDSAKNLDKMQLMALGPPSAERIPVVLVHGLMSRPVTWNDTINELSAHPDILKNYQLFVFRYPTGVPVVYSAAKLRESLAALHKELVRIGNHRAANHMVLIGHSMGGLLSRAQVQESGDHLWEVMLGSKSARRDLTEKETETLSEFLEFHPNPYVDRVIFICSPHRGSKLAEGFIGAIGRRMIRLPGQILGSAIHVVQGPDSTDNPAIKKFFAKGIPSSVQNLNPDSQFVKTSNQLAMKPGVHIHSIIGNKDGLPLTDPKCGDGTVPYRSAHLDGVESELVIRSDHGAHGKPEAIAEIRRILLLHLKDI